MKKLFEKEMLDQDLDTHRLTNNRSLWRHHETEHENEDIWEEELLEEQNPWEVAFEMGEREASEEGYIDQKEFEDEWTKNIHKRHWRNQTIHQARTK